MRTIVAIIGAFCFVIPNLLVLRITNPDIRGLAWVIIFLVDALYVQQMLKKD